MLLKIKYRISDHFGGVPDGHKYEIEDTRDSENEWRALLAAFASEFPIFAKKDYEFADWHYEMRSIFACLYNEEFYKPDFIPKVQQILRNQKNESFAKFECFDNNSDLVGCIMIFKHEVIFNRLSEECGLIDKLNPKDPV
jgi:hypothetical protein